MVKERGRGEEHRLDVGPDARCEPDAGQLAAQRALQLKFSSRTPEPRSSGSTSDSPLPLPSSIPGVEPDRGMASCTTPRAETQYTPSRRFPSARCVVPVWSVRRACSSALSPAHDWPRPRCSRRPRRPRCPRWLVTPLPPAAALSLWGSVGCRRHSRDDRLSEIWLAIHDPGSTSRYLLPSLTSRIKSTRKKIYH